MPPTTAEPLDSASVEKHATTRAPARRRAELALASDARLWTTLAYAAAAFGCVLRLLRYVDNPALWLDEAFLSLNLMDKSLADVLGPLDFLQSAPPGFLLVEKGAEMIIGDAEQSLRLFPMLASLASVVLFLFIARRVLAPPAAVLAIVLFATGEPLLERAAEVKPYSVDVMVATLLAALTLWFLDAPPSAMIARAATLGAVGIVALWLSFTAAFTLAAAVAALSVHALAIGSRRMLGAAAVVGGVALAIFGAVYAVASSNVSRLSAAIFSGADDSATGRLDTVQDAWSVFVNPGGFANGTHGLAALLACFGVFAFARRGMFDRMALFALPPLLAIGADLVHRYPLSGRFSLFLVPSLLVLVALGAEALVSWSRRPLVVSTGLAVFLVASPLALGAYHILEPPAREDIKPLLMHLAREWKHGDALYVYPEAQYALRYYSTCEECAPSKDEFPWPTRLAPPSAPDQRPARALESVPPTVIVGVRDAPGAPLSDLDRAPRAGRLWLLFSHVRSHTPLDDERVLLTELQRDGELLETVRARGAQLYLYERPAP